MPTATVYASSDDFYITSQHADYSTARSGGSLSATTTGSNAFVGQRDLASPDEFQCIQAFLTFDTSSVPAGEDSGIDLVVVTLSFGGGSPVIEVYEHAWVSAGTGAWVAGADLAGKTLFGSVTMTSSSTLTVDSSLTEVPRSSTYRLVLAAQKQRTASAPTGNEYRAFSTSEATGTTNDPYLTWTYTSATHYTITADGGSYTLTGTAAGLRKGFKVAALSGAYTLTGQTAALRKGFTMAGGSGAFALTGQAAGLLATRLLNATGGSYALTGDSVALLRGYPLIAGAGDFALTGTDAGLRATRLLPADSGAYTLTGDDAGLLAARTLTASGGAYTLTGGSITVTIDLSEGWHPRGGASALWFDPEDDATVTWTPASGATTTWT